MALIDLVQARAESVARSRWRVVSRDLQNHDAELSFWREPDTGRSVVQPAVLVDDQEGSGSDVLPGEEALLEVGIHGEHGLLREAHRILPSGHGR